MSLQVEKLEKNMAKLTIEVSPEELEKAIQGAYQKNRGKINMPGFRKGKAPRIMIEKMYGAEIFYEDAANAIIPEAYGRELDECDLEIVSQPQIDVTQLEKGKPFIFTAEVALKPSVTLGEYKGITIEKVDTEVTEEEIDAEVNKELEKNARTITVEDRAVLDGDILTIDFTGSVDGEPFEGGQAEDYGLTIGSHSFIDNFEEQLIGASIGEEMDVNVTFPEDYQAAELAGKPALFRVTVKGIKVKELPEADDDFAKDISEFDTISEYRDDIKARLAVTKENDAKAAKEDAVITKIIEGSEMEIPDPMLDMQARQLSDNFSRRIQSQGLTIEQYYQFTGMTSEKLLEQMRPQALKTIQSSLVLEAIAHAEAIEITEERLDEEVVKMAEMYKMEVEKLVEIMGENEKDQIKNDLKIQEAVKLVTDLAVEE